MRILFLLEAHRRLLRFVVMVVQDNRSWGHSVLGVVILFMRDLIRFMRYLVCTVNSWYPGANEHHCYSSTELVLDFKHSHQMVSDSFGIINTVEGDIKSTVQRHSLRSVSEQLHKGTLKELLEKNIFELCISFDQSSHLMGS